MRGIRGALIGVGTATVLAVTGCSSTVAGTAHPDPSAAVRLDTGGYPTSPRPVPERTDPNDRRVQSSYELAGYLISPADVDAAFDWAGASRVPVLASQVSLAVAFGMPQSTALAQTDGLVGGAVSARQTAGTASADTASMTTYVIRYRTAATATAAGAALRALRKEADQELPGRPGSFRGPENAATDLPTMWWQPHQDYLLGVGFKSVPDERAVSLAGRWLDRQTRELAGVTTTVEQLLALPPDRDGIMSLTIPDAVRVADGTQPALAYMSTRAWLNVTTGQWTPRSRLYERAGVDLIGSAGSTVFRTRSAASARYLLDAMRDGEGGSDGTEVAEAAPPGLAGSRCSSFTTSANGAPRKAYQCVLAVGRYYLNTGAVGTLTQAHQQAAASYLMAKDAK
ncbi:DUF7373 family lipoprotein [Tsukamurella spumae]|uniref:Uncharacterized protein n=1 Tax=Tsukamurella spumae TaxID=44753 RepID=A0A846X8U4_9ACTN|nr:hypothetical protein [Tsukamurella spumae]NKY20130.1 hypothetical protein [Tsukamurella spumae]